MLEMRLPLSIKIILTLIFSALIVGIGGFTPREAFTTFILQYVIAFAAYLILIKSDFKLKYLLILGLVARISLVFFTPELSNDFYRFIWDGEMLLQGINPYDYKPNDLISFGQFLSNDYYLALHKGMGQLSQENYSCYPILNQLIFAFSSLFSDNIVTNTAIMKGIIILADIGTVWIGMKTLRLLELPAKKIAWYFLNPLIILEFSGNLHFEGVAIFFLTCFLYFIIKNNWLLAGLFLGFAVQIKLIPFMLIPFVYKKLKWKKSLGFTAVSFLTIIVLSQLLIASKNINHFSASLELYYNLFQSHASIFSWVNEIYSSKIGWDTTYIVGPFLGKLAIFLIVVLGILKAYKKPVDIFVTMLFAYSLYYMFSTTVNPWYISSILFFSIFTPYKFGIVWSFLIMLSYLAYSTPEFTENRIINTISYAILYLVMVYEIIKLWKPDTIKVQIKHFFSSHSE